MLFELFSLSTCQRFLITFFEFRAFSHSPRFFFFSLRSIFIEKSLAASAINERARECPERDTVLHPVHNLLYVTSYVQTLLLVKKCIREAWAFSPHSTIYTYLALHIPTNPLQKHTPPFPRRSLSLSMTFFISRVKFSFELFILSFFIVTATQSVKMDYKFCIFIPISTMMLEFSLFLSSALINVVTKLIRFFVPIQISRGWILRYSGTKIIGKEKCWTAIPNN